MRDTISRLLSVWGDKVVENPGLTSDAMLLEDANEHIDAAFRELCARDMIAVQVEVMNLLAEEIEWLRENRPLLTELERGIVAKKLLQQQIRCYLSQLDQIL